ncbi:EAL domain-containing protein [Sulfidibacter corallicola]|uniref:EAL domain-containing protein n=1 Tax=Sulfidibacter corallicola TaxID=2818388 RepID=A0A8A4TE14_SULCO|nr:EAL domain-containing protein [Sulfidibacter corallicola]QTD47797.1 EAL domain-containing protein [Sulfidibacter corallicola]
MKQYEGKILVVDDFDLNRDMLVRRLKSRGFDAWGAEDGRNCLKMIEELPLDLVLLDIMMPDMDGFEVVQAIRADRDSADLAVIMVTAKDNSEDIVRALELGADDYVTKPIDFAVVLARIKTQMARRNLELALRESEERFALAARGSNDGLWDWNLRTQKVYFSDRWKAMLGWKPDEIADSIQEWFDRVHRDDLGRLRLMLERHLSGEAEKLECEYRIAHKDGKFRWMLCRGMAVCDVSGRAYRMAGWQTDTTNRGEHDILTSLPNRGLFLDRLSNTIQRCSRSGDQSFAAFYVGIDRFRVVNDSLGHKWGDQILIKVARRLETLLDPGDTLARLGGDEFSILVEGINSIGSATDFANRVREELARPIELNEQEVHITAGLGIALADDQSVGAEEILRRAHSALDQAKARGKNAVHFYDNHMTEVLISELQMENELRRALDREELYLQYQPQIDTCSGRVVGAEALIRWKSEKYGHMPPGRFIPLAEETGLIVPIGDWVLETACRQNQAWRDAGLPPIRVAINLSSRQFRHHDIFASVQRALDESGLDPTGLDLELTESLLMEHVEETIAYLERLHELGVQISVDDFGTGYSSLAYLKRFPLDTLKIDRSFVTHITSDPDDAAICSAIIGMAHNLRMRVIAEGVETQEHLYFLRDLNCDELQGFFFSPPLLAPKLAEILKNNKRWLPGQEGLN